MPPRSRIKATDSPAPPRHRQRAQAGHRTVLVHLTDEGRRVRESRRADRARHLTPLPARLPPPDERAAVAQALPALSHLTDLGRNAR